MNKSIICVWGMQGYGKSSVVKCVYNELLSRHATNIHGIQYNSNPTNLSEFLSIVNYNGNRIGIESQNDNDDEQKKMISFLVNQRCDIIVCASQSQGNTRYNVEELSKKNFDIFWMSPFYYNQKLSNATTRHPNINNQSAKSIVDFIDELIRGNI